VDILYGYPTDETLQAWKNKEIELGGCIVGEENPNRKCMKCNHQWKTNDND
jgi:Zn ribbon nucleic-acid-binding protein